MKLERATHNPSELLEFYEQGLGSLGALCERTWHDRLEVIAEGSSAKLWNPDGALHEVELRFAPADATSARDAACEVFAGCPLTFRLAETLRLTPMPLERFLQMDNSAHPPESAVAEKVWRAQFPDTTRLNLIAPFKAAFHFSLIALTRCEIQAIDQHWSLHRIAMSLPGGELDDSLAHAIDFFPANIESIAEIPWPATDPVKWSALLRQALEQELDDELGRIRARQENSLRRELERIDDYFENYERELSARTGRSSGKSGSIKMADRLAAAKADHTRRRADQVTRHEIRVHPHVDALLLIAERAWKTRLEVVRAHRPETIDAHFIPRSRRWTVA